MNTLPFHSFVNLGHITSFTLTRNIHGYEEVSIMDVYQALSNGFPMYALAARSGDEQWSDFDLRNVARITPSDRTVKTTLDIWRALFLSGCDDEVDVPGNSTYGVSHLEWSKSVEKKDNDGDTAYRIVVRGATSNIDHGYAYIAEGVRPGIIFSQLDAVNIYDKDITEIFSLSLPFSNNSPQLQDTINYLVKTYEEDLIQVIQKRTDSGVWVDDSIMKLGNLQATTGFNKEAFIKSIQ